MGLVVIFFKVFVSVRNETEAANRVSAFSLYKTLESRIFLCKVVKVLNSRFKRTTLLELCLNYFTSQTYS